MHIPNDKKPPFGAFIPLAGLSTDLPQPRPLHFACRNGDTYCTNPKGISSHSAIANSLSPPANVPYRGDTNLAANDDIHINPPTQTTIPQADLLGGGVATMRPDDSIHVNSSTQVSGWTDYGQLYAGTENAVSSDANVGDTTDDNDWHLGGLDARRKASRPTGAVDRHLRQTNQGKEKASTVRRDSITSSTHAHAAVGAPNALPLDPSSRSAEPLDHHDALVRASMPSPGDDAAMARFEAARTLLAAKKQQQLVKRRAANKVGNKFAAGQSREYGSTATAKVHARVQGAISPNVKSLSDGSPDEGASRRSNTSISYTPLRSVKALLPRRLWKPTTVGESVIKRGTNNPEL